MKNMKKVVLFIPFLSFFLFFIFYNPTYVEAAGKFPSGSTIANIDVSGLTYQEANIKLQEEVLNWIEIGDIEAKNETNSISIPRSIFQFHIDQSLDELEERTKRVWHNFFLKKRNVHLPLYVDIKEFPSHLPNNIDEDQLKNDLVNMAQQLGGEAINLQVDENKSLEESAIAEVTFQVPDISNTVTSYVVEQLNGVVIEPNSLFSLLDNITLMDSMKNVDEELSFIATALYHLILKTEIEPVERHKDDVIPEYSDAGLEVKINLEKRIDLKFYNLKDFSFTINSEINHDQLIMTLSTVGKPVVYEVKQDYIVQVPARTIYRYDPDLLPGKTDTIQEGKDGLQVEIYRELEGEDYFVSRDYYRAEPEIIAISTKENESVQQSGSSSNIDSIKSPIKNGENSFANAFSNEASQNEHVETLIFACINHLEERLLNEGQLNDDQVDVSDEEYDQSCQLLFLYFLHNLINDSEEDEYGEGLRSLGHLAKNQLRRDVIMKG